MTTTAPAYRQGVDRYLIVADLQAFGPQTALDLWQRREGPSALAEPHGRFYNHLQRLVREGAIGKRSYRKHIYYFVRESPL